MRENVLRWMGGLAAVSMTVGFVALGVAVVTWRTIRGAVGSVVPSSTQRAA